MFPRLTDKCLLAMRRASIAWSVLCCLQLAYCRPSVPENVNASLPVGAEQTQKFDNGVEVIRGWVSQPNGRGTFDILWSCVATVFLCSWSVLCVNIPEKKDGRWTVASRKLGMAILGNIGPEFILQIALGQLISARQSVRDFHESGYFTWTVTHGFFADMGGFILHTPDFVQFPLNAKQLHYMVTRGYLDLPRITKEEIDDKNKLDVILRTITLAQTLWFVVNCIA